MSKNNIEISLISNRSATIIYSISTFFTGICYFYYAKQIRALLPGFLTSTNIGPYLIGTAFILAGIAIFIEKQITTVASLLLAILLFCVAVAIDLRGIFNKGDDMKFIFSQALLKDIGLIAGAIFITNFQREKPARRRTRRHGGSSRSSAGLPD